MEHIPGRIAYGPSLDGYWHEACARVAWDAQELAAIEFSGMVDGMAHGFACRGCFELLGDED